MEKEQDRIYCRFQTHLRGCVQLLAVNTTRFQEFSLIFGEESFVLTCHTETFPVNGTDIFDSADW